MTKTLEEIQEQLYEGIQALVTEYDTVGFDDVVDTVWPYMSQAYQAGLSARSDIKAAKAWLTSVANPAGIAWLTDALQALQMVGEKVCENTFEGHDDGFSCSLCGFTSENISRTLYDEHGEPAFDEYFHVNACPSCGARVKEDSDELS